MKNIFKLFVIDHLLLSNDNLIENLNEIYCIRLYTTNVTYGSSFVYKYLYRSKLVVGKHWFRNASLKLYLHARHIFKNLVLMYIFLLSANNDL